MKASLVLAAALTAAISTVQARSGFLYRRQDDTCKIDIPTSNGGRKVAVVLDSSGSMLDNDPGNLRIIAGKALNAQLVPSSAASGGASADLVTVIDFDYVGTVVYPLGDPSGADSAFDQIDSSGGTSAGDGISKAIEELTTPGHGDTKDRSGIIVLTDGEDGDPTLLLEQIKKAGSLGIRVSFGYLKPPSTSNALEVKEAILQTGGTYSTFQEAESIQPWLYLLLSNGLTAGDSNASKEQPLLSGITVAKISGTDAVSFSYAASQGEKLVFTVESLSQQDLDVALSKSGGSEIGKNSSTATEPAELTYEASGSETLLLSVTAVGSTTEGVFQVSVNSSLGLSGCNLNQTKPSTNTTSVPTRPPLPTVTAGVAKLGPLGLPVLLLGFALAVL
ncbi:hypothetical protein F5X68DRAFT_260012 [Plectosphaerella plurivora]|uniref:VWFA domain-containing protein n=1 Tax=Plectosphaerella plurivora TaxID=936078 RepID=A0A9P8VG95_9PEZI|nr:hypothetical protein F5X68DRAFT_260012 [Plectosphaerella plurivora]